MTQYIIESNECDELSGEALCWNNEDGWVDRASATLFEIDEMNANAHLIAAAPAMYEALVETMRVLRSLRDNKEEWYTLVTPELLTAWDKNKAALAQAEGRQA